MSCKSAASIFTAMVEMKGIYPSTTHTNLCVCVRTCMCARMRVRMCAGGPRSFRQACSVLSQQIVIMACACVCEPVSVFFQ